MNYDLDGVMRLNEWLLKYKRFQLLAESSKFQEDLQREG